MCGSALSSSAGCRYISGIIVGWRIPTLRGTITTYFVVVLLFVEYVARTVFLKSRFLREIVTESCTTQNTEFGNKIVEHLFMGVHGS